MRFRVDMDLSVWCGGAGKHTRARRLCEASKQSTVRHPFDLRQTARSNLLQLVERDRAGPKPPSP
jgi:hypothetical protein